MNKGSWLSRNSVAAMMGRKATAAEEALIRHDISTSIGRRAATPPASAIWPERPLHD